MKYDLIHTTFEGRTLHILVVSNGKKEKLPVLYMQDGQNLFDDQSAAFGVSWGLIEEWKKHSLPPIVIIGIDCRPGMERLDDYCPYENPYLIGKYDWITRPVGGQGDAYLEWIVTRLKPFIESQYPVDSRKEFTGIAGSSMGGYIATYAIIKYPHIFTRAAGLSNAYWFAFDPLLEAIKQSEVDHIKRLYIDCGTFEEGMEKSSSRYVDTNRKVADLFQTKGLNEQLMFREITGGIHHESAWRQRIADIVKFIFDWQ